MKKTKKQCLPELSSSGRIIIPIRRNAREIMTLVSDLDLKLVSIIYDINHSGKEENICGPFRRTGTPPFSPL